MSNRFDRFTYTELTLIINGLHVLKDYNEVKKSYSKKHAVATMIEQAIRAKEEVVIKA